MKCYYLHEFLFNKNIVSISESEREQNTFEQNVLQIKFDF